VPTTSFARFLSRGSFRTRTMSAYPELWRFLQSPIGFGSDGGYSRKEWYDRTRVMFDPGLQGGPMPAFLVPLQPGALVIPLEKAILLVGRQSDCDVSLTTSRKISRKHCCIAIVNDNVIVRDLGSTNGISINGERVKSEGRVRMGDELCIGDVRFRLQRDATIPPSADSVTPEQVPISPQVVIPGSSLDNPRSTYPESVNAPPPSLAFPVAIAEDGRDFAVEATFAKLPSASATVKKYEGADSGPLVPFLDEDEDIIPLASSDSF
jgi:hypothetical protein